MDDNDVCPLCCEELDMSDRQFFPCKCGYQVCMWCWHRIRESESGLCPACRTPYGDDPHEFSAVDMEEVVKANKEKTAAEKREKERLRQQQASAAGGVGGMSSIGGGVGGGLAGVGSMHIGGGSDGDMALAMGGGRGHLDPPKDRSQLANMRVIRRNLVYGVGLPPSIATEEMLRKPEYFGQYGKICKIVLNRNHNGNGDPRRASASAYVTFSHKEDTLACILAMDGFYLEGRNIRASYGTSKYCSAFIKNVRCNNPDCTYLHIMGDPEDTFTKQEIQAGYVTSGRDVLARQQQLAAATSGSTSRRRVGSGGPSSTGKVPTNPILPPPTYDEPSKPSQTSLVPPPPSTSSTTQFPPVGSVGSVTRSSSAGFSSVAAAGAPSAAAVAAGKKIARSTSVPISNASTNTIASAITAASNQKAEPELTPAELLSRQQEQLRKMHPQNNSTKKSTAKSTTQESQANSAYNGQHKIQNTIMPLSNGIENSTSATSNGISSSNNNNMATATAASVVAGVHSTSRSGQSQPAPHSTLTALTPLKREKKENASSSFAAGGNKSSTTNAEMFPFPSNNNNKPTISDELNGFSSKNLSEPEQNPAHPGQKKEKKSSNSIGGNQQTSSTSPSSSISSASGPPVSAIRSPLSDNGPVGVGSIGGAVLGSRNSAIGSQSSSLGVGSINAVNNQNEGSASIGSIGGPAIGFGGAGMGGHTIGGFGVASNETAGNSLHQWNSTNDSKKIDNGSLFGDDNINGGISGAGIWGSENASRGFLQEENQNNGGIIGGSRIGQPYNMAPPSNNMLNNEKPLKNDQPSISGSSALASMLGIELPTGVGSLRESLWASSTPVRGPESEAKSNIPTPTPIGAGIKSNDGLIIGGASNPMGTGGIPIGGYGSHTNNPRNNNSDMALLQSLLPGVHITGGNAYQPAAPNSNNNNNGHFGGGWDSMSGLPASSFGQEINTNASVGIGGMMEQQNMNHQQQRNNKTWETASQNKNESKNMQQHQSQKSGSNIW